MRHRQQLRAPAEQRAQVRQLQRSVRRDLDIADRGALLRRQPLPRDQVRVVLHLREDDLVTLAHVGASPGVRNEVDRLRRVAGKDHRLAGGCADEARDLLAGLLIGGGGLFAQGVHGAVDVRVVRLVVADERVDHLPRLLRGRRVVQIDQPLPVDLPFEDRKVAADGVNVQRRTHSVFRLLRRIRRLSHAASRKRGSACVVRSSSHLRSGSIVTESSISLTNPRTRNSIARSGSMPRLCM